MNFQKHRWNYYSLNYVFSNVIVTLECARHDPIYPSAPAAFRHRLRITRNTSDSYFLHASTATECEASNVHMNWILKSHENGTGRASPLRGSIILPSHNHLIRAAIFEITQMYSWAQIETCQSTKKRKSHTVVCSVQQFINLWEPRETKDSNNFARLSPLNWRAPCAINGIKIAKSYNGYAAAAAVVVVCHRSTEIMSFTTYQRTRARSWSPLDDFRTS